MAEKKRILIPGGAGYIGSHVALTVLNTRKYRVTIIDNFHNSKPEAVRRIEELALRELPADATEEEMWAALHRYKYDEDRTLAPVLGGVLGEEHALHRARVPA